MLARQIGAIAGLPVIHLDHHYWSPGWVPTPDDEWVVRQRELLAGERWVVDGNYGGTLELRAELADTIVFLDLPRRVCLASDPPVPLPDPAGPGLPAEGRPRVPPLDLGLPRTPGRGCSRSSAPTPRATEIVQLRSAAEVRAFSRRAPRGAR